jgi:hypothetical protein
MVTLTSIFLISETFNPLLKFRLEKIHGPGRPPTTAKSSPVRKAKM